MAGQLQQAMLYSVAPIAAAMVGGVIAAIRPPGKIATSVIQHFAAGVVFAAAALELVPSVRKQAPDVAIIGFAIGIAVILLLRWVTTRAEQAAGTGERIGMGLVITTGLDMFVDGLVMGAGFAKEAATGILLTISLFLEFIFFGLAVATTISSGPRWKTIGLPFALSLSAPVGVLLGVALLSGASAAVLAGVLAAGAVALMYLVTEELLVEAHAVDEKVWMPSLFFIGFLVYLIITEVV